MFIKSIELNQFRNYENLNLQFDNGTNILYGDNAQGKTNEQSVSVGQQSHTEEAKTKR